MAWKRWQINAMKHFDSDFIRKPFHILTATLLTLLLPLSFLLLSRVATANYLLSLSPSSQIQSSSVPIFFFFCVTPAILCPLVSLISSSSLIQALTGQTTVISQSVEPVFRLPECASWLLLCIFQACVGLGIQGSEAVGISEMHFGQKIGLVSRVVFFLGLHETMTHWSRMVVKPVVDDSILGHQKEENWTDRMSVTIGLGLLWWWRLKVEIESLAIMVIVKKELMMGVGLGDFVGWWLYYLTVTIGFLKFARLAMWFAVVFFFKKIEDNRSEPPVLDDEKV